MAHPKGREALDYFLLMVVLTLPFWLLGVLVPASLLPGLPIAALAVVVPAGAALILAARRHGMKGAAALLSRLGDFDLIRPRAWLLAFILFCPAIAVLSFTILRLAGEPVPDPSFAPLFAAGLFLVFFITACAEELGWTGYALSPLQARFGFPIGALILGLAWAAWHVVPLIQAERSWAWIGWWAVGTISSRVIMTWLYNHAGSSVFGASLYHAMSNLSWQLFPVDGSWFDPRIHAILTGVAASILVIVSRRRPPFQEPDLAQAV